MYLFPTYTVHSNGTSVVTTEYIPEITFMLFDDGKVT